MAGLTIAWWGVGPAMMLNALSFVAVLLALLAMDPSQLHPAPRATRAGGVREGLRYVRNRPDIMLVLFMVFMLGTFGPVSYTHLDVYKRQVITQASAAAGRVAHSSRSTNRQVPVPSSPGSRRFRARWVRNTPRV